jgi:hypothetical protein
VRNDSVEVAEEHVLRDDLTVNAIHLLVQSGTEPELLIGGAVVLISNT